MAKMTTAEQKAALEKWKEHCRQVQSLTGLSLAVAKETPSEKARRIKRLL